jgi:uncharacterized phage protein (TIGR01671 family)
MREIKFRAWDGEEMRYTFSVQSNGDGVLYSGGIVDWKLMQFTGLKDKNGKEIFEGDICSTYNIDEPSNLIDTVVFDDGSFVFQNDYKLSAELRGFKSDYIEIIGNIYEHPELLNK